MAAHNDLGKQGEEIAKDFFVSKGFRILASNWRSGRYELDFIAENEDLTVIVEVKTRVGNVFGNPEDFITDGKMQRILRATHNYILANKIEKNIQIDVVSIVFSKDGSHKLEHFPDAITPKWYYGLYK
ncbi:MAG: YraN family protein [Prevotellaceae bacterium]|jgi:putative endonuclease|nr:YraN family protein [Prevotellaceae bacterium]